jgi:hypothetical protein
MRQKKISNTKRRTPIAIVLGITIVGIAIFLNYTLDQSKISGQQFGDRLAQIQSDLKNETQNFDVHLTQYKNGQISKDMMLKITDEHIQAVQNMLPRYNELNPPELFAPSLQLFRLSTDLQIDSDKALRDWIVTGNNATSVKSDQLLQQSFQYEMNALQSYENAKSKGS